MFGADPAGIPELEKLFSRVISLFVGFSLIALFVMLIWAGIRFLTSGGDAKSVQSARQVVVWALLGMLFLIIAWLLLQLIQAFTGVNVTRFCININGCP